MLLHHLLTTSCFTPHSHIAFRRRPSHARRTFISCHITLPVNSTLISHISHLSPPFTLVHVPCAVVILFFWLYFFFPATLNLAGCIAWFQKLKPVCVDDVVAAVSALPDISCASVPLLTTWLKAVVDVIPPFLTHLFNCSLFSGIVPEAFKIAYIMPLSKKSDMDPADTQAWSRHFQYGQFSASV